MEASYRVSLLIAKTKKPHTIGEDLILPSAKEMVSLMIGQDAAKKMSLIPLSDSTVNRRIADMAQDTTSQNVEAINRSPWHTIQLDESTDIASCAQLIVWFRFIKDGDFVDEPLICKALETTTKGEDVFVMIRDFYENQGLDLSKLIASTTDGAPAMLGKHSGFGAKLKHIAPNVSTIHCMIHRQALASKTLPDRLMGVLSTLIKMVNHIKASALNTRLFRLFCQEMDADHMNLLFYTKVRWLSRGNVVLRVYELREELKEFFRTEKKHEWVVDLESSDWLAQLCYLSDIFERLNLLNRSLQGTGANLMIFHDKIKGFLQTMALLKQKATQGRWSLFPRLSEFLKNDNQVDKETLTRDIVSHIESVIDQFELYFPEIDVKLFTVARNPFEAELEDLGDDDSAQEELVCLKQDSAAEQAFKSSSLSVFWCKMLPAYPKLSERAIHLLMPYPSTYLCEQSFSTMVVIKTKDRNRLFIENDMILALSRTDPRIKILVDEKQAQGSH